MSLKKAVTAIKRLSDARPLPLKVLFVAAAFHFAPFSFVVLLPFAVTPTLFRLSNIVQRHLVA